MLIQIPWRSGDQSNLSDQHSHSTQEQKRRLLIGPGVPDDQILYYD